MLIIDLVIMKPHKDTETTLLCKMKLKVAIIKAWQSKQKCKKVKTVCIIRKCSYVFKTVRSGIEDIWNKYIFQQISIKP